MRGPVITPVERRYRYASATYWSGGLAAARTAVYPGGALSTGVDQVETEWDGVTPPSGCASITRYTVTDPGGRSGGSPAYVHLLNPVATPRGACIVFLAGHAGWWDSYCTDEEAQIIPRMLGDGYHVLAMDMPNYGLQPLQAVVLNGVLCTMAQKAAGHIPGGFTSPFSGPSLVRLFTDHAVRAMNQVTTDTGISTFALVGHSGGGSAATLLAPLDSRFRVVHLLQGGGYATSQTSNPTHLEISGTNDLYVALGGVAYAWAAAFGAAFSGRTTVVHDDGFYQGDQSTEWTEWANTVSGWLDSAHLGTYRFYRKLSVTHYIDASQVDFVLQSLHKHC